MAQLSEDRDRLRQRGGRGSPAKFKTRLTNEQQGLVSPCPSNGQVLRSYWSLSSLGLRLRLNCSLSEVHMGYHPRCFSVRMATCFAVQNNHPPPPPDRQASTLRGPPILLYRAGGASGIGSKGLANKAGWTDRRAAQEHPVTPVVRSRDRALLCDRPEASCWRYDAPLGGQKRTRQEARQGGGEYYSWFSWHPDRLVCPRGGIVGEAHRPRFPPYTTCCHVRATTTNARRRRGVKDPGQSGACQALSFPNHIRQASPPMGHWPCSSSPSCRRDAGRAHSWHRVCSESADCRMPCIGTLARTLAMAMSTADDGTTPACLRPRRRRFVMAPDGRTENRSCPAASPQAGCEERGKRGRRDKKARPGQSPIRGPKISGRPAGGQEMALAVRGCTARAPRTREPKKGGGALGKSGVAAGAGAAGAAATAASASVAAAAAKKQPGESTACP